MAKKSWHLHRRDLLKGAGLTTSDTQVRQALRFGAATQEAQEACHRAFAEFLRSRASQVDAPAIVW